jgi:hypothetical protein
MRTVRLWLPLLSSRCARHLHSRLTSADARAQLAAARGQLFASLDGPRLQAAQRALVTIRARSAARAVLSDVLQRALSGAATSRAGTDGIVADHRATLIAVAFYVNNWGWKAAAGGAHLAETQRRLIVLRDREDYAQHFAVSAGWLPRPRLPSRPHSACTRR